jgi:hypothetical protein
MVRVTNQAESARGAVAVVANYKMKIRKVGAEDAFFTECECCGTEFRCGPHIYDGQNVPGWDLPLRDGCKPPFRLDHEISPKPRLLAALKAKGISASINARGMLAVP